MNLVRFDLVCKLKIFFKRYKCCCCGKKLKTKEIAAIGPETLVWCKDCRGASGVYQQIWVEEKMSQLEKKYGERTL
jgi:hypothetical protein